MRLMEGEESFPYSFLFEFESLNKMPKEMIYSYYEQ